MNQDAWRLTLAYIDPGTGGMVLQLLFAAILGAGFYFRKGLTKLLALFTSRRSKNHKP